MVNYLSLERVWKAKAGDMEGRVNGDFLQWEGDD
jgi:hypothetical protein